MVQKVGIVACKGGVGKTALVVNIAHALVDFGREVLVVDADLHRPNVGSFLGFTNTPKCIHTALNGKDDVQTCTYLHPSGVRILPGNAQTTKKYTEEHHRDLYSMIAEFSDKVEIILVDTPPGTHHDAIYHGLDAVIGVTTSDSDVIHQLDLTLHHITELGIKVLGVVVNKTKEHDAQPDLDKLQQHTTFPIIGNIPYGTELQLAQQHKYPVTFTDVHAPVSIAIKRLAANLIGETYVPDVEAEEKSPWKDIFRIIGLKD